MSVRHAAAALVLAATSSLLWPSAVWSFQTCVLYETCELCVQNDWFTKESRPCVPVTKDGKSYVQCYKCPPATSTDVAHFDTQGACENGCDMAKNKCQCNGACYNCVTPDTDTSMYNCDVPTYMYDNTCNRIPFIAPV